MDYENANAQTKPFSYYQYFYNFDLSVVVGVVLDYFCECCLVLEHRELTVGVGEGQLAFPPQLSQPKHCL